MTSSVEIHGFSGCPFAWRVRLAAHLKGVACEWLPCDASDPDARCAARNPAKRSPLLYDDGFALTDAQIIAMYLDESRPGPALQPSDPKERALARLASAELAGLLVPGHIAVPPEARVKAEKALTFLEGVLSDGRAFVGGASPMLVDVIAITGLASLERETIPIPTACPKTESYWDRSVKHPAFVATRPAWAKARAR